MSAEGQSPLRALAPASIVVFAIALLIVVALSVSGGDDEKASSQATTTRTAQDGKNRAQQRTRTTPSGRARRFYTVKPGDNLATIAEQTGVSLERLRELNQTLDPQGLVSGQKVKLPAPGD